MIRVIIKLIKIELIIIELVVLWEVVRTCPRYTHQIDLIKTMIAHIQCLRIIHLRGALIIHIDASFFSYV